MTKMKRRVILFLLAWNVAAFAADEKPVTTTTLPHTKNIDGMTLKDLTIENLRRVVIREHLRATQLESALYQCEGQKQDASFEARRVDALRAAGLDPEKYDVNLDSQEFQLK